MKNTTARPPIIGVMGPGSTANEIEISTAYKLGSLIAKNGWWLLTGGSNTGVMHAALKGAKEKNRNCVTIGILSNRGEEELTSQFLDIKIPTGMGEGRNNLNILTSDIIVVCCEDIYTSLGTMSEVIFALKHKKPLIFLSPGLESKSTYSVHSRFLSPFPVHLLSGKERTAQTSEAAIRCIKQLLTS